MSEQDETLVAVIGLAGRFAKAYNIEQFWENIKTGRDCFDFSDDESLIQKGIAKELLSDPNYVKRYSMLDRTDRFDAEFFQFTPNEARFTDPQFRMLLECAYEALENAGYPAERDGKKIGVFAGLGFSESMLSVLTENIYRLKNDALKNLLMEAIYSNRVDFAAPRISYKLGLTGPSINISTACSTSLVAIHYGFYSLLNYECDIALVGSARLEDTSKGYLYREGGINSPDGYCRAFDRKANGTVGGSGVGVVLLKRLEEALTDGDHIEAVLRSTAINNDGNKKIGFIAPSVSGQASVIVDALETAEIDADSISYVETHGTGTSLGDPIEIEALSKAYRLYTQKKGYCAIGSIKTNIGHLDAAAGIVGFIKTVLALKHKQIPPSLFYDEPNPKIDFANSPFYVNQKLQPWEKTKGTRCAGVSSFGIGGTNAHAILEEAPETTSGTASRAHQLFLLSAKTSTALETMTVNLNTHLERHADLNPADVAHTLQVGRASYKFRRMWCLRDKSAMFPLSASAKEMDFFEAETVISPRLCFMFPGQGAQQVSMFRDLYEQEAAFRDPLQQCCRDLVPHLGLDLSKILYPEESKREESDRMLQETWLSQPALFAVEYALVCLWKSWGVEPQIMIGHSLGEYVAACVAGVFTIDEALKIVALRGKLIQELPSGDMITVALSERDAQALVEDCLNEGVQCSLAVVNAPFRCVISGPSISISHLVKKLSQNGKEGRLLPTSHAFHSAMLDPILDQFRSEMEEIDLNAPNIPFVSNVTGKLIRREEAIDPAYWTMHMRQTVQFSLGIETLMADTNVLFLEVGPGQSLSALVRQQTSVDSRRVVSSARSTLHPKSDQAAILGALGRLWTQGVQTSWDGFYEHEKRLRLPLPTYPYEYQSFDLGFTHGIENVTPQQIARDGEEGSEQMLYVPNWQHSLLSEQGRKNPFKNSCWLFFLDQDGFGKNVVEELKKQGANAITVTVGEKYEQIDDSSFVVDPYDNESLLKLVFKIKDLKQIPDRVIHFWSLDISSTRDYSIQRFKDDQYPGIYSILFIIRSLSKLRINRPIVCWVVTNQHQNITAEEQLNVTNSPLLAACNVIPQEYSNIRCINVDLYMESDNRIQKERAVNQLVEELKLEPNEIKIAYRGNFRWHQTFSSFPTKESSSYPSCLRTGGVYLITGGLGDLGLLVADFLVRNHKASVILIGRSAFPLEEDWDKWLLDNGETDRISRKILRLRHLKEVGPKIVVKRADVGVFEEMEKLFSDIDQSFGILNGIIHAAGIVGKEASFFIEDSGIDQFEDQYQAKVYGLLNMSRALGNRELDFFMLMSSLASILGGMGTIIYSAVNSFMDSFAIQQSKNDKFSWISVNWDYLNLKEHYLESSDSSLKLQNSAIDSKGVEKVLEIIFSNMNSPQIAVSTTDLKYRIKQWASFNHDGTLARKRIASRRAGLGTEYVAPRNEIEEQIAAIWRELFGYEKIGIHDDFFETGGDSILLTKYSVKLGNRFGLNFNIKALFNCPTISDLALEITKTKIKENSNEDFKDGDDKWDDSCKMQEFVF